MALAPADLRGRIETRVLNALGGASPPWRVSALAYDSFPGGDLDDKSALAFAVGLPDTSFLDPDRRNQTTGQAAAVTTVGVRFTSYMRPDAHVTDYDAALTREAALVAAVTENASGTQGPVARVIRIDRRIIDEQRVFFGEATFTVFHGYPI